MKEWKITVSNEIFSSYLFAQYLNQRRYIERKYDIEKKLWLIVDDNF